MLDTIMLILHIVAGYLALGIGLVAMFAPKKRGRHTTTGKIYFWLVTTVCASAVVMAILNWEVSSYLFYIAIFSFLFALVGYIAYQKKRKNWMVTHIAGMGGSYIAMVTGFIVVNQQNVAAFKDIPSLVFWLLPTIIGTPIIKKVGDKYDIRKRTKKNRNLQV
jgi:FtsH-binding integral membrane protein